MTTTEFRNVATGESKIGYQAGIVVNLNGSYRVPPDATPERIFREGVELLNARILARARMLIERAVDRGYINDEVRLHRLLALLSGKTMRQLTAAELDQLARICAEIPPLRGNDRWTVALRSVLVMLALNADTNDAKSIDKAINALPRVQREMIIDHLGLLLEGSVQDRMWRESVERAQQRQMENDRANRVWIFFQDVPRAPRLRRADVTQFRTTDIARAVLGSMTFLYAAYGVGNLLPLSDQPSMILACVLCLLGSAVFLWSGAIWHFRRRRIRVKDAELVPSRQNHTAPEGGFANEVDRLFDKYFRRYVPRDTNRSYWLKQTAGLREHLRDEVVMTYRDQKVKAGEIAWLIRHMVSDVKKRWQDNTLTAYREKWRTPVSVQTTCLFGLLAIVGSCFWIVPAAVSAAPLAGLGWTFLALSAGAIAAPSWFAISSERQREAAEQADYDNQYQDRCVAFERWSEKLAPRPSDREMADWLECDRKKLVDFALRRYRLKASHVIAHAFIEAPADGTKRARVQHGPLRYSDYQMLLFLLTDDGVRQVDIHLDFETTAFHPVQRLNYRFDAVAAVKVRGSAAQQQFFELTLVNGDPITALVSETISDNMQPDENLRALSEMTLDASGLPRTLNVLEGVAAEGKEWIRHQKARADHRLNDLGETLRDVIG
ncbi:hypothetical protein [Actinoplanes philippinensis]|uniref:hypothetical protein n=1 Tax=Actinoplanes philippinensis TaxID=35752 RepID=UPI0033EE8FB8